MFKRIASLVLVVTILNTLPFIFLAALRGDVNGDDKVDIQDILALRDYIFNGNAPPEADVNGDGKVDIQDILAVRDIIFGISINEDGALIITVLDVGQGDSIFIVLPSRETLLIDAGESRYADGIIKHIKDAGFTTLNYVVATHPHADHIGGMAKVVEAFDVKNIYMPNVSHTTVSFEKLLDAIDAKDLTIKTAKARNVLLSNDYIQIEFIAPISDEYKNLNNYSAVLLITFNNKRFLLMGDAEVESEAEILQNYSDIKADWIKIGHHGSVTATSDDFINAVNPSFAAICVGKGNNYKHPSELILERLANLNCGVWRTDENGAVTFQSDGYTITVVK
ncbi:MAG: MBL fold metallo-hydrolase [Clostridia bacterium]|nr:MBL fold metallo-hydrolase [Clostridia bacterium]